MGLMPIIVMPARDEAALLRTACLSLGFGRTGSASPGGIVVVDNASRDGTNEVAAAIAAASACGSVELVYEAEPGHVPARHAGTMAAVRWARELGIDPIGVLVLQADADTAYRPGYVQSMMEEAERVGPGHLVEGCSVLQRGADDLCVAFRALEAAVDSTIEGLVGPDDPHDVVVDDKVAAFRLSDYLAWGGHVREYDRSGDEVLAETTRLYMRAVRCGGRRTRAEAAEAVTSQRRILEDPSIAFATAGFPRSRGWAQRWRATYRGPHELAAFTPDMEDHLRDVVEVRAVHMRTLFGLLPAYVRSLAAPAPAARGVFDHALAEAGLLGARMSPGEALWRLLELARDTRPARLPQAEVRR